jgi:hypothetical protein
LIECPQGNQLGHSDPTPSEFQGQLDLIQQATGILETLTGDRA